MNPEVNKNTAWKRLKAIYTEKYSMERYVTMFCLKVGAFPGFIYGTSKEFNSAVQRFEIYATGKSFGNKRNAMRRRNDFVLFMCLKRGIKFGLLTTSLSGILIGGVLHISALRDRFSLSHPPLMSAFTMSLFALPTTGAIGAATALTAGFLFGSVASLLFGCWSFLARKSVDDQYKKIKIDMEARLRTEDENWMRIKRLMNEEKIYLRSTAEKRLQEIERLEKEKNFESPLDEFDKQR